MSFLKKFLFNLLIIFAFFSEVKEFAAIAAQSLPFEITARKIETFNNFKTIIASGDVIINNGQILIWAQEVKYEVDTEYAILIDFKIFDKVNHLIAYGDKGFLDVRNGELWADKIFIYLKKQGVRIKAWGFHKNALNEYTAKKALVTTCQLNCEKDRCSPPWSIVFHNFVLTAKGITTGDSTEIRIKKIPIFYLPKFVYLPKVNVPVSPVRKTGFLTPHIVHGSRLGFGFQLPFFWALTDQLDFTAAPLYFTKRGTLLDLENEFKFTEDIQGLLKFRYLKDKEITQYTSEEAKREKWWFVGKIDFLRRENIDAHLDWDIVSEKDFLQEFDVGDGSYSHARDLFLNRFNRDIEDKGQEYRISKFWIQYHKNSLYIKMESNYLDYHGSLDKDEILQPFLSFKLNFLPFKSFNSLITNFSLSYFYNYRKEGYYGHKVNSKMEVSYPFKFLIFFNEGSFRYIFDYYNLDEKENFENSSITRNFYELEFSSSTLLFKHYKFLSSLHILKPYVTFFYRSKPEETNIPHFTYEDLINEKSKTLEYGLWQFFSTPAHKNFLIIKTYQQYDFTKAENSTTATSNEGALSDLYFQILINYSSHLRIRYDTSYNFSEERFKKHSLTVGIKNFLLDSINLTYQDDPVWNSRQLTLDVGNKFFNKFFAKFYISRNLINKETTEMGFEGIYSYDCYSFGLGVSTTPKDTMFWFRIELKGLGGYGIQKSLWHSE
jgi:LPS-assembly protein